MSLFVWFVGLFIGVFICFMGYRLLYRFSSVFLVEMGDCRLGSAFLVDLLVGWLVGWSDG